MAIRYRGFGYIALRSRQEEAEALRQFFTRDLGFPKVSERGSEWGEAEEYYEVSPGQYILIYAENIAGAMDYYDGSIPRWERSYYHSCFELSDRFMALQDLKEKKGLIVAYAEDDSVGPCGSHLMTVQDTQGGEWELVEFTAQSRQLVCDPEIDKYEKTDSDSNKNSEKYLRRLSHCTFCCRNYPQMVDFYQNTLELPKLFSLELTEEVREAFVEQGYKGVGVSGGELLCFIKIAPGESFELLNIPYEGENNVRNQEFHHVCLIVEDIRKAAAELREKGVRIWNGPSWHGDDVTDRADEIIESFFVEDPEGNQICFRNRGCGVAGFRTK